MRVPPKVPFKHEEREIMEGDESLVSGQSPSQHKLTLRGHQEKTGIWCHQPENQLLLRSLLQLSPPPRHYTHSS